MTVDEVKQALAPHLDELKVRGVVCVSVFGSVARGESRPGSDVDLLVSLERPVGLFGLAALQRELSTWLARRVDLVTEDGLKAHVRDHVLREAVRAVV